MKIGVLFNCQGDVIAQAIRALSPQADTVYVSVMDVAHSEQQRQSAMAILAACDHILIMDGLAGRKYIPMPWLRRTGATIHRVPTIRFRGFHPDTVMITPTTGRKILGPTAGYHSKIAIACFLGGLSEQETLDLYNALVFARLGYFGEYERQFELMRMSFESCGFDFSPIRQKLQRSGCFMHSINHPKVLPLFEIAIEICKRLQLPIENKDVRSTDLPDLLGPAPTHPMFPEIAARIGIEAGGGAYRSSSRAGNLRPEISHEQFITGSFNSFAAADRAILIATEGIREAIASLGLGDS